LPHKDKPLILYPVLQNRIYTLDCLADIVMTAGLLWGIVWLTGYVSQNAATNGGNAEGAKLPHGYVAEKTNPGALELKKSPSSLDQEGLCKGLLS